MNNSTIISIIIPTYNRAHLVGETLDSIIGQSYENWECIIVDDGSIDNTCEVVGEYVKRDSRFQFHHRPITKIKGPNSCRNYGFNLSKGNYINWIDSDDIYLSNALEEYQKAFDKSTDVVIGKVEKMNFNNNVSISINKICSDSIIEDHFTGKITYFICGPMWKRDFLIRQDVLFDEEISNLDDWDFNLRMLYTNPKTKYLIKPLIQYRMHENSLSREIQNFNYGEIQSELRARKKHLMLLKNNKNVDQKVLLSFVRDRYKYFFREAMARDHSKKYYLLKNLLIKQIAVNDFLGVAKILFGFAFFSIFNKGYVLLK